MSTPAPPINSDQSTFLAYRSIDAETLPQTVITHVALPGAKQAIPVDFLEAYQEQGHDQHAIVQRVNDGWGRENDSRLQAHARWVAGPYHSTIEQMRRAELEAKAEQLRAWAKFQALTEG